MTPATLFLSHGAPDLPIRTGPTQTFLGGLFQTLPRPQAIVVISAHWLTAVPTVGTATRPPTLYDFGGFPPQLSALVHRAPGAPTVAQQVVECLRAAGFPVRTHDHRGYDHGVWTPLILADPEGVIPVVPLSLQPQETPAYHLKLGQALAPLREEGVMILGSGAATHNLWAFSDDYGATPPDWAIAFDDWLAAAIARHDRAALVNYRHQAPHAEKNHPTEEHLLPLFVALGAGGQGYPLHRGFTYGAFSMAAYGFD